MFDSITIRATAPFRTRVDLGEIAESLLFYSNVHLALNESELTELVQKAGLDTTLALIEGGHSRIMLLPEGAATHAFGPPGEETYNFVTVQRMKGKDQFRDPQEIVTEALFRATQRKGQSRRAAQRFLNHASIISLSDPNTNQSVVCDLSRQDIRDPQYIQLAISEAIMAITGELPPPGWRFEVVPAGDRLRVLSNLDYEALTARVRARFGAEYNLTPALLLDFLHQARVDLYIASTTGSELLTSGLSSKLILHRLRAAVQLASTNKLEDIELFQSVVLQGHRLGDAIRSGHKTIDQTLDLVERAQRFRSWLAERPSDSNLLSEYYKAVTERSWVERLPGKHLSFAIFAGLGVAIDILAPTGIGIAMGLAAGAAENYLVERLAKGWNPSQFIDRDLVQFLGTGGKQPPRE